MLNRCCRAVVSSAPLAGLATLFAVFWLLPLVSRADYYGSYGGYYSRSAPQAAPIISLELDPQKSRDCAFRVAAREGRYEDLKRLIKSGADIDSQSDDGTTALMYASRGCYADEVRLILRGRARINMRDSHKRTALMYAVSESCEDVVKVLLGARDVSFGGIDDSGESVFDLAHDAASEDIDGTPSEIESILRRAAASSARRARIVLEQAG